MYSSRFSSAMQFIGNDEILYSYTGTLSQNIIQDFVLNIENTLLETKPNVKSLNKLLTVLVEILQNMYKYCDKQTDNLEHLEHSICFIALCYNKEDERFYVVSSNSVSLKQQETISYRIDKVNSLSEEQLKEYHRSLRKNGTHMHEEGAGFGFAEIARKAYSSLEYQFDEIDAQIIYTLKVILK